MMWRTHLLCGLNTLWLLHIFPGTVTAETIAPQAVAAALGALLPDLDAAESKLKSLSVGGIRPFVPVAFLANRTFGHRGLLHSPVGLLLASLPAVGIAALLGNSVGVAFWSGYLSHLIADACTRSGVPLGLSRTSRRLHLLPERWRFVTGSPAEDRLLPLMAIPIFALLLRFLPT